LRLQAKADAGEELLLGKLVLGTTSIVAFFRRVAGRDSGRRVACLTPHCRTPEVRLLFGAEYPKGIEAGSEI